MENTIYRRTRKQQRHHTNIVAGVIIAAIIGGILSALFTALFNGALPIPPSRTTTSSIAVIARAASKGTVSIVGTKEGEKVAGSGFVVSNKGYIVTCAHVVSDNTITYTVNGADQQNHPVKIVYKDTAADLAILQTTDGAKFTPLPLGNSNILHEGDQVIAIGNPFGLLSNTITTGVISGIHRDIMAQDPDTEYTEGLSDVIQIDAPLNPGESGGPILNSSGEVIGVSAASDTRAQNISFAIPINTVKKMLLMQNIVDKFST